LQNFAHSGQAILCTIPQPSVLLFQTFDQILVLGSGGKPLYFGEIGPDAAIMKDYSKATEPDNAAKTIILRSGC